MFLWHERLGFHAPFITQPAILISFTAFGNDQKQSSRSLPGYKNISHLEELLADTNIELVVVNTPSVTHYEYTKQVLNAGKIVLWKNRFTATVARRQQNSLHWPKKKTVTVCLPKPPLRQRFQNSKESTRRGLLGKIVEAEIHYDRFLFLSSAIRFIRKRQRPAVGALYDLGSHLIDQAYRFFGMPVSVLLIWEITGRAHRWMIISISFFLSWVPGDTEVQLFRKGSDAGYQLHGT